MKVLVIQNYSLAPLGILHDCIIERSAEPCLVNPLEEIVPAEAALFDGLIVLGGLMNAEDDENYPHLRKVVGLITQFAALRKPILGICLGAQLIARAFGKRVFPNDIFELGFLPISPIATTTASDPLLKNSFKPIHLMEWHYDTFELPDEATLLMTGETCKHQVYRISDNIYGFQCHFEVSESILRNWLTIDPEYLEKNYPDFPFQLEQQIQDYIKQSVDFCRSVGDAWLDLIEKP